MKAMFSLQSQRGTPGRSASAIATMEF